MTPGTGKRISRACLRCWRRKTKCNLDGIGEPKKPPCESCHRSNSECVLIQSRRGASRVHDRKRRTSFTTTSAMRADSSAENDPPRPSILGADLSTPTNYCPVDRAHSVHVHPSAEEGGDGDDEEDDEDDLRMELRNPSDALQILSHARNSPKDQLPSQHQGPSPHGRTPESVTSQARSSSASTMLTSFKNDQAVGDNTTVRGSAPTTLLDEYELVQRGLLHPAVIPELLHIFKRRYHSYCPIVPPDMLGPDCMSKFQRPDYFLLTVILVIASRDSPRHLLTHRYCWDHAERLLLEVLLAERWAQSSRTVQALLLLSEWLPYRSKQESSGSSMSLMADDQSAWSIIGLAVRQGYLLRLDRAAFKKASNPDSGDKGEEEGKRLIWTFIYLADRQISVRLGQSFWSRGPSLSSTLTAQDFPSLKPPQGSDKADFAMVLQAQLELTQILYNAHGILYSSTERTLAMVNAGDYARYLDDFQRAALTWHASWRDTPIPENIRTTLFLLFEYVCLYVNAFSFQAVLTRATGKQSPVDRTEQARMCLRASLFSQGLMTSPDGPYIYEAISSARKILGLFEEQSPDETLRYLPTRYHLYGVYAAVFLHKAQRAGVFQSPDQEHENCLAARRFIQKLEKTSTDELHHCRRYSTMLKKVWERRGTPYNSAGPSGTEQMDIPNFVQDPATSVPSNGDAVTGGAAIEPQLQWSNDQYPDIHRLPINQRYTQAHWAHSATGLGSPTTIQQGSEEMMPPDTEDYFFGLFFPGIMDTEFVGNFGDELSLQ